MKEIYYQTGSVTLYHGDCLEILSNIQGDSIEMIFSDPPYNLSNGGITCHAGRMVSVNKGNWDKSNGIGVDHEFSLNWLSACKRVLKDDGTIWISGTMHNIYSIGYALQQLGFKLLNEITWFKPNAAPNLSCRYFTHSHETIIWAAKSVASRHKFNYGLMKQFGGGKQMRSFWADIKDTEKVTDIWSLTSPAPNEKLLGKHPTQKPISLMERIILSSTNENDLILDPFTGSSTTGVAAIRHNRQFIGIDNEESFLELSKRRINAEEKQQLSRLALE